MTLVYIGIQIFTPPKLVNPDFSEDWEVIAERIPRHDDTWIEGGEIFNAERYPFGWSMADIGAFDCEAKGGCARMNGTSFYLGFVVGVMAMAVACIAAVLLLSSSADARRRTANENSSEATEHAGGKQ